MDSRFSKWIGWLDVIESEVQDLVISRHTFREIETMIAGVCGQCA